MRFLAALTALGTLACVAFAPTGDTVVPVRWGLVLLAVVLAVTTMIVLHAIAVVDAAHLARYKADAARFRTSELQARTECVEMERSARGAVGAALVYAQHAEQTVDDVATQWARTMRRPETVQRRAAHWRERTDDNALAGQVASVFERRAATLLDRGEDN